MYTVQNYIQPFENELDTPAVGGDYPDPEGPRGIYQKT